MPSRIPFRGVPWHEEFPREIVEHAEPDSATAGLARYAGLRDGVLAGCDVAVITTQPGSRSHHHAQRQGFDQLYTRAVLVKRP